MQAILVHIIDDNGADEWYITDLNGAIISPICTSWEQLRWALGQMCNAVNSTPVEIVR